MYRDSAPPAATLNPPNPPNRPITRGGRYTLEFKRAILLEETILYDLMEFCDMRTFTMSRQPCSGECHHSECSVPKLSLSDYGLYLGQQLNTRMLSLGNWNLPCFALAEKSRNHTFVGRDDILRSMDEHLLPQETSLPADMNSIRSFAICGESGIGKTDLAIEYAYSRKNQFGAVFWLHAGSAAQLMTDYCQIPSYLGLTNTYSHPTPESRRKLAKAWLNNPKKSVDWGVNCRWLLIFDQADDLDVIANYIPRGGNGSILITSRNYAANNRFFENGAGADLGPLSIGEATTLLQRLVLGSDVKLRRADQKALKKIASLSYGVPGAITSIAESIQDDSLSLSEYAELLTSDVAHLAKVRADGFHLRRM